MAVTKEEKATWEKSVRLNEGTRDLFVDRVLEDIIPAASEPDKDTFIAAWAAKLYDVVYPPEVVKAIQALPLWMQKTTKYFFVDFSASLGQTDAVKIEPPNPVLTTYQENNDYAYRVPQGIPIPKVPKDHAVHKGYHDVGMQIQDWHKKRKELARQLTTMIKACNTSHQLYEAWPGALKYAKELFPFEEKASPVRGGNPIVSANELEIGIMMARSSVYTVQEN